MHQLTAAKKERGKKFLGIFSLRFSRIRSGRFNEFFLRSSAKSLGEGKNASNISFCDSHSKETFSLNSRCFIKYDPRIQAAERGKARLLLSFSELDNRVCFRKKVLLLEADLSLRLYVYVVHLRKYDRTRKTVQNVLLIKNCT